ncbi:ABC transporter substrate-binding protein [Vibrio albus]|uniref:ABC transporter substrate-binding protein n=1 Tax=Vibrio albus TaxID=2200953 RepID=A0A2U3BB36_9VIBR|nr:extracellular solute-binding protein [Vibrio albus]PWI34009.1 ABC transporter substrate-binding protein [Vibrio albus]
MKNNVFLSGCCLIALSGTAWGADLPDDLQWTTNISEPLFASENAIFGGTFRTYISSFPQTFRTIGPDANGAFRAWLLDAQPGLVSKHPNTDKWIPALATEWAFGHDNKTVYYRLNPKAEWSDGEPVTADDFTFMIKLMRSKDIIAPWYNTYYSKVIQKVTKYDEHTLSVTLAEPKDKRDLLYSTNLAPRPEHFYKPVNDKNGDGIADDFVRRYNFKAEPTTWAYKLDKVKKGRSLTFKHVGKDWWGYTNPYYRNRYNVARIRIQVIRDNDIAKKHFEKGDLDAFGVVLPSLWHEKTDTEPYRKGYIHKFWGFNQTPQGAGGLWLNTAKPLLNDINVRKGIALATDFDGMIEKVLRGDYVRKPNGLGVGQGLYTNTDIKAPEFEPKKAAEYFAKAGFDSIGPDGIRINEKGERLSFAVTYAARHHTPRIAYLKEQAKLAGLELTLNLIDGSSAFKYVSEKKHDISFHDMGSGERPQYWEYFHSVNANKPQTNNFTNYSTAQMDDLIMQYRNEFSTEKREALSRQIQKIIAEAYVIVPGYMVPYTREAYWRWMKFPKQPMTKKTDSLFSISAPYDLGTYWIDPELKKETKEAMEDGKTFEPVTIVNDTYKF